MTKETREALRALLTKEVERRRAEAEGKDSKWYEAELYQWEVILVEFDDKCDTLVLRDDELRAAIADRASAIEHRRTIEGIFTASTEANRRVATALERIAAVAMESK